ncbi:MAG: LysM peptidoglycan-binding domain-containing protein [Bacteroidales bacterium]|nr:LysM peptidoglycan-binding domain-containing protein [Bacteroidales bacterium]
MKKISLLITYIFLILTANSQTDTSLINSNNKVKIDGKDYYIHRVEKKQTLYSISKLYNVSTKTIIENNLNVKESIAIGQFLKIPVIKNPIIKNDNYLFHIIKKGETIYTLSKIYNVKIKDLYEYNPNSKEYISVGDTIKITKIINNSTSEHDIAKNDEYVNHKVEKKQTLYAISKLYDVKIKKIKKANPELYERELQEGEVIKIPKKRNNKAPKTDKDNNNFKFHKVEKKQTLYAISILYDVKIRQIKKANPELKNNSIIEGQIIKIPVKNADILKENVVITDTISKPVELPYIDTIIHPCNDYHYTNQVFNIALMLPFYTNINDTLGLCDSLIHKKTNKIYSKSKIFLEFYQGILLSIEKLKEQNVSVNLYVYDTQNDTMQVKSIIQKKELEKMDLIIGPVYSSNLQIVSKFAKENQINIVSPLSLKNSFLINNPYAFQVSPPLYTQIEYTSEYLNSFKSKNFLVIHDGKNPNTNLLSEFKTEFFKTISKTDHQDYNYTEIYYYQKEDSLVEANLSSTSKNIIIIPSESRAFVSDIIAKLNAFSKNYDITLFGRPHWVRFDNIQPENFHNLQTQIFTNSYIDYKKENVKNFVKNFRTTFQTEPTKFSFQAFDISYYFINALKQYGKDFKYCLQSFDIPLLETKFHFEKKNNKSGYENKALYIVTYNKDYDVVITSSLPKKPEQK